MKRFEWMPPLQHLQLFFNKKCLTSIEIQWMPGAYPSFHATGAKGAAVTQWLACLPHGLVSMGSITNQTETFQ